MSNKENVSYKIVIPIILTLFILPRFGINQVALFQTIASKIIPILSMIR